MQGMAALAGNNSLKKAAFCSYVPGALTSFASCLVALTSCCVHSSLVYAFGHHPSFVIRHYAPLSLQFIDISLIWLGSLMQ
jgi:hypothetical protein